MIPTATLGSRCPQRRCRLSWASNPVYGQVFRRITATVDGTCNCEDWSSQAPRTKLSSSSPPTIIIFFTITASSLATIIIDTTFLVVVILGLILIPIN